MARTKNFDESKAQLQAMQLFWRKGYAATSIEDLVQALNLSRSSLYDTFGDKRTLFLHVLRQYSQRVIAKIADALQRNQTTIQTVEAILQDLIGQAGTPQGEIGCFMVNSIAELVPYDAEVTQIAVDYTSTIQRMLVEQFARTAPNGEIDSKWSPEQRAAYLFNTMQGLRLLIKAGATPEQLKAIAAITVANLN